MRLLLNWVLSAAAVWIVAQLGLGISVRGLGTALVGGIGHWIYQCHDWRAAQDYYLSFDAGDAWAVLVGHQRTHAGACFGAFVSGVPCERIPGGVHRSHFVESSEPVVEGDRDAVSRQAVNVKTFTTEGTEAFFVGISLIV